MVNTLSSFPHLPLLSFAQTEQVLDSVGMPKSIRAALSGISRQILWKCENGQEPGANVQERLSLLSYKVMLRKAKGPLHLTQYMPAAAVEAALEYDPVALAKFGLDLLTSEFGTPQEQ